MAKVMISDCDHQDIVQEHQVFEQNGFTYALQQCKTEEDVVRMCKGATVLLNQYAPMNKQVFSQLKELRCVVRYGVGVDNINLEDANQYGVQICNVPDYGIHEVSDHALAMMMSLLRKIHTMNSFTKNGQWDYTLSIPIRRTSQLTVGVIGVGRIGSLFAQKANALGYNVLGYDIEYDDSKNYFPTNISFVSLQELISQSDVISIHCSLNESSRSMFNEQTLAQMKKGSYLINVSRGGIVDELALADAIKKGHLAGAALDVVLEEPIVANHPLLACENVIITPHMAWYSEEASLELKRKCAEEAVRFIKKEPLWYPINQINS